VALSHLGAMPHIKGKQGRSAQPGLSLGQRTLTVQREVQVGNLTIGAEDLVQMILIDVLGKALDDDLLNEPPGQ